MRFGKEFPLLEQFRHLEKYLIVAGIKISPKKVLFILFLVAAVIDLSFLTYFIFLIVQYELKIAFILIISFIMFTLGYLLIFLMVWLFFLLFIDYRKFKRRTAVEEILPEFLRLVSANHRAGLPLDVSLWKANRPRFGILSEEINEVARRTYAKGDLIEPLTKFGSKYDSPMLKRVISNLVEGLKTGADIANLLDDVSTNITTIKNTRKELASEVENYMIFITVAVLVISPLMFALTFKMTGIIEVVKSSLSETLGDSGAAGTNLPLQQISFEGTEVPFGYYFNIFVYLMTATNCVVSVLLMSMVKYGNIKQELKKIPIYYLISISVFIILKAVSKNLLVI